jgi:hypothetical protein
VYLLKQVQDAAEGVIFAAPSFCDPALLERPMLQTCCSEHNIPYTAFKYAENSGPDAADPRAGRHLRRLDQALELIMTQPTRETPEVIKEPSMVKQKEMIAGNYDRLTSAKERPAKTVVSTFVPAT